MTYELSEALETARDMYTWHAMWRANRKGWPEYDCWNVARRAQTYASETARTDLRWHFTELAETYLDTGEG